MKKRTGFFVLSLFFVLLFTYLNCSVVLAVGPYVDNGDGTITDSSTRLRWQKADDGNTYNWKEALAYCENCTIAGYSDWRLPNARELFSIVDNSAYNPSISTDYFTDCQKSMYWSGSTNANDASNAWDVVFSYGGVTSSSKTNDYYVRCVRLGPSGSFDDLVIYIAASKTSGNAPLETSFSCTVESGTPPYTYSWNFGDGTQGSSEQSIKHNYVTAGSYTATVSVTDSNSQTASKSIEITVGTGGDCTQEYNKGRQDGMDYCKADPAACGITSGGGCTQAELEAKYQEGCTACSGGSGTPGTVSPELNIHMPTLLYNTAFGNMNLWVDFEFAGESNGDLLWKLSDFGENE